MSSKNQKRFNELFQKVNKSLSSNRKSSKGKLPEDFKYLRYWAEKLKFCEPKDFAVIEKEYMNVAGKVGDEFYANNYGYLKKADKHAVGTKARLVALMQFVYHYSRYNHICFIEAGQEEKAKEKLKLFWDAYGNEIIDNIQNLDEFQVDSVLKLMMQSKAIGVSIKNEWVLKAEKQLKPPDRLILAQVKSQIKAAEENLDREQTIEALVNAVGALELMLRDLYVRLGPSENNPDEKEDFARKSRFKEYVAFLFENGYIHDIEKGNLLRFNDWRNCVSRFGLEPSVRIVRLMIDEIKIFIDEHSY